MSAKHLFKKSILILALATLLFNPLAPSTHATTIEEGGVEASLTLDKTLYETDDEITVSVEITNQNLYAINNVSAASANPSAKLTLTSGQMSGSASSLATSEALQFAFTLSPSQENGGAPSVPSTGANSSSDNSGVSEIFPYVALGGIGIIALAVFIGSKSKKGRRRIILPVALAAMLVPSVSILATPTHAAAVEKSFQVEEVAHYSNGETLNFILDITYETEYVSVTYYPGEGATGTPVSFVRAIDSSESRLPTTNDKTKQDRKVATYIISLFALKKFNLGNPILC
ncbi:MAG: hypothetical protein ACK5MU_01300 [Candidatus Saccharimonadales bacterium]